MCKWNLVFDVALCTGCHNCTIAVQDEYVGNAFPGYAAEMPRRGPNWVTLERRERGTFPMVDVAHLFKACLHCDDPSCLAAARDGAVRKRDDGIVVIDPERARGQTAIARACPYGAVHWDEGRGLPQHWNFDAHLIDGGWPAPRPVQACPTGALRALKVTDEEMTRLVQAENLLPPPGARHGSRIHYRNLARYTGEFAGGTLVAVEAATQACVGGATVVLSRGGERVAETTSDIFGDFRFAPLPPASGHYRVDIAADRFRNHSLEFELNDSRWLGEIVLEPAE